MRFLNKKAAIHTVLATIFINILILAILILFLGGANFPNENKKVYTTKTGECYHLSHCSSLRHSRYETTLKIAVYNGYRSCSNCDSPVLKNNSDFTFNISVYILLVPIAALWSRIAIGEIFQDEKIPYVVHLLICLASTLPIDILF